MINKIFIKVINKLVFFRKQKFFKYNLIQELIHLVACLFFSFGFSNNSYIIAFIVLYFFSIIVRHILIPLALPVTIRMNSYHLGNKYVQPIVETIHYYALALLFVFFLVGPFYYFIVGKLEIFLFFMSLSMVEYFCYLMVMPTFNQFILPKIIAKIEKSKSNRVRSKD